MSVVLAVNEARPDDYNFVLFVHILSAMVLVGSLLLAGTVLAGAWRDGSPARTRVAYRTLLIAVLPAWLVMRVFAQILADKPAFEPFEDSAWMEIGFITTEPGLLLLIGATVAAGVGSRKALRDGTRVGTSGRVAAVLVGLMIVAYVVAIWAMTAKPV
jgi:hypothetical protein